MTRKFALTGAAIVVLVSLNSSVLAGANDYVFEAIKTEIKSSNVATVAVRLVHKPSGKPVTDAVIVQTRIVMAHDGGAEMASAFVPLPARSPACTPSWRLSRWREAGSCPLQPRYRASPKLWSARSPFG